MVKDPIAGAKKKRDRQIETDSCLHRRLIFPN